MNRRAVGGVLGGFAGALAGLGSPVVAHSQRYVPDYIPDEVVAALEWGIEQGLPRWWAYRVAQCETGGTYDPGAYNRRSGASGLFQFIPSTWRNSPQGRRGESPFNVWSNVGATVWLYFTPGGGPRHWSCK